MTVTLRLNSCKQT